MKAQPSDRPRYRHFFRCCSCGGRFHVDRLTADPNRVKTPKCPRKTCSGRVKTSFMADKTMDVSAGKAPALLGAPAVQAYDYALESAAQNAGLTNVNDRPDYGESSVPKLRPDLQQKVDNFWGPPSGTRMVKKRVDLSGIFGGRATAAQQASPIEGMTNQARLTVPLASAIVNRPGAPPPVNIVAGDGVVRKG